MTESLMLAGLGFVTAVLAALLALPAVQRRADRLAQRRAERLFPMSIAEIQADRDHVRAECAVTLRAVERRHEAAASQRQQALLEVGHRDVEIAARRLDIAERDARIFGLEATLATTRQDLDQRTTDLAAECAAHVQRQKELSVALVALQDRERHLAAVAVERADLAAERDRLATGFAEASGLAETRRIELEQRTALVLAQQDDLAISRREIDRLTTELESVRAIAGARAAEIEVLKMQGEQERDATQAERDKLALSQATLEARTRALAEAQQSVEDQTRQVMQLQARVAGLDRALAEAGSQRAVLEQRVQSLQEAYDRTKEALRSASLERAREAAEHHSARHASELAVQRLTRELAEQTALLADLQASRKTILRDDARAQRDRARATEESERQRVALRREIARVGDLFLQATGRAWQPSPDPAQDVAPPLAVTGGASSDLREGLEGRSGPPVSRPRRRRPPAEAAE